MPHSSHPPAEYISLTSCPKTLLKISFSYWVVGLLVRQWGHNLRANFWETIPVKALDNKYLSTSISKSLSIVFKESLVCIVDKTKCPVIDARTAILAVSVSRISPTIIILGSCLKIDLKAVAKSSPISLLVWIWLIPAIFISIGSSTVIILVSSLFNLCKIE